MAKPYKSCVEKHCKACGYDPLSGLGGWREQVAGCTVKACALWPVRPLPKYPAPPQIPSAAV
jgi:hypothetical protein